MSSNLAYHLEQGIPLSENVFRYGSKSWGALICEARELYDAGAITELDEDDYYLLESDAGKLAEFEGREVMLDTPQPDWDNPGTMIVYVNSPEGVKLVTIQDVVTK